MKRTLVTVAVLLFMTWVGLTACRQAPTAAISPLPTPEIYHYDGTAPYTLTETFVPKVDRWTEGSILPFIFDEQGNEHDWAWLVETFGDVKLIISLDPAAARIIALYASTGPAVLVAHVQHADGSPNGCATVVRFWPDAPLLGDPGLEGCGGLTRGVYGSTNGEGDIGFGLGPGDYYWPPKGGASAIWLGRRASDCIVGLGMLGGTEHRHLNVVFELP